MPAIKSQSVSRRVQRSKPEKLVKTLSFHDFSIKRKKILVTRGVGGLGDILMHRMMFEDMKILMPDAELTFALPTQYHPAVIDHPFIDHVVDSETVERQEYMVSYNTSTACGRYETAIAPKSDKNRSDIWAEHCGFQLTKHDMHIRMSEEERARGREIIEASRTHDGPVVLISPISAMVFKNLLDRHLIDVIAHIKSLGCCPMGLHTHAIPLFQQQGVSCLGGLKIREWMAVIHEADSMVAVDTSSFHCAGGMRKPVVGIFSFASGDAYGKHYPTADIVQGPCPLGHRGCYNWCICPVKEIIKPCITQLESKAVLDAIDRMIQTRSNNGKTHGATH